MWSFDRREFLWLISGSVAAFGSRPLAPLQRFFAADTLATQQTQTYSNPSADNRSCWLDVCAPFIVEDDERGIHTEIVLTSDTFVGTRGYEDGADATDYEVYLYDAEGRAIGADGIARRLAVPAMRTTVLNARELIGNSKNFWGGMKIRLRPRGREPMPASDLFSSAFVRWQTKTSFDNVHANPDPLQWQRAERFYYSMPFPPLAEYVCTFALFNPYRGPSAGEITVFDPTAGKVLNQRYQLKPYSSLLFSLNTGNFSSDPAAVLGQSVAKKVPKEGSARTTQTLSSGGLLAVTNDQNSEKSFGYLLIKRPDHQRFSVEHPIHQDVFTPRPETAPFDGGGNFKAKNVLYSPLVFRAKRWGSITLESRCFLGTGLPIEQALWLYPFVTDDQGGVQWLGKTDPKLTSQLPAAQLRQGAIHLSAGQSCVLDFQQLTLKQNFSGGICLGAAPDTTHTLMKVEVRVPEWGAHAFTHFRPGLRSARSYQKPKQRGGIATDYITTGARLERRGNDLLFDELIGVMNIDDQGVEGRPVLELFGNAGLVTRVALGAVPGFACRHYSLSELAPNVNKYGPFTLRLIDEQATLLMSIMHLDYARRDIALDHGSDRFSTLLDYNCKTTV